MFYCLSLVGHFMFTEILLMGICICYVLQFKFVILLGAVFCCVKIAQLFIYLNLSVSWQLWLNTFYKNAPAQTNCLCFLMAGPFSPSYVELNSCSILERYMSAVRTACLASCSSVSKPMLYAVILVQS